MVRIFIFFFSIKNACPRRIDNVDELFLVIPIGKLHLPYIETGGRCTKSRSFHLNVGKCDHILSILKINQRQAQKKCILFQMSDRLGKPGLLTQAADSRLLTLADQRLAYVIRECIY